MLGGVPGIRTYFPAQRFTTLAGMPIVFKNWLSSFIHSVAPTSSNANEPTPEIRNVPSQPCSPAVTSMTSVWPDSTADREMWTDDDALRSASAFLTIWTAVSPASGLADGGRVLPHAAAPARIAAQATATATARSPVATDVRTTLLLDVPRAKDRTRHSSYRHHLEPMISLRGGRAACG